MANAKLNGQDIVGVESVEYNFEPFKYSIEARPQKTPAVVKGAPQLRTVRVSGVATSIQVDTIRGFEELSSPVSFSSPVVSLSKCVVKRLRISQHGSEPASYSIEIQEVDDFIEVNSGD